MSDPVRYWRLVAVAAALGLLAYGLMGERHQVESLTGGAASTVTGGGFIDAATWEGFMRRDGRIFAVGSLAPDAVQAKDCKT